jgi:hypothetical protein
MRLPFFSEAPSAAKGKVEVVLPGRDVRRTAS